MSKTVQRIEFVDSLPEKPTGGKKSPPLTEVLSPLVAAPGRWAAIDTVPQGQRSAVKWYQRARRACNVGHRWQFSVRGGVVYARYLGEAE